jgi:hypothetical protein
MFIRAHQLTLRFISLPPYLIANAPHLLIYESTFTNFLLYIPNSPLDSKHHHVARLANHRPP